MPQFDTAHTIATDGDLVYLGDRENARIEIFDTNGRFLRQWNLGHPGRSGDHPGSLPIYVRRHSRTHLENRPAGKGSGQFQRAAPRPGTHLDPHEIALAPDGPVFTAEVVGWRAEKLRPK